MGFVVHQALIVVFGGLPKILFPFVVIVSERVLCCRNERLPLSEPYSVMRPYHTLSCVHTRLIYICLRAQGQGSPPSLFWMTRRKRKHFGDISVKADADFIRCDRNVSKMLPLACCHPKKTKHFSDTSANADEVLVRNDGNIIKMFPLTSCLQKKTMNGPKPLSLAYRSA